MHSGRASSPASVSNSSYPDQAGYKAKKKKKNHITKETVKFIAQDIRIIFLIFMNSSCVGILNSYSLIAVCKWQAGH